jgi:oxidase EvaA
VSAAAATAAPPAVLGPREDTTLPARLALSAAASGGGPVATGRFDQWLEERRRAHGFEVHRIPFAEMDAWHFAGDTGNLVHRTGRFFTVEGLHVRTDGGPVPEWYQPIIRQPEVGILCIVAQETDGVLRFLMQAKMEPGNSGLVQLSPTIQATRSNYTRVHRGAPVRYLEYVVGPERGRVVADVLQSEHGWWFYRKNNRNVVVELDPGVEVPLHDDFCWLTLGEINTLMTRDNVINMDSRTVLSCLPAPAPGTAGEGGAFRSALAASFDPAAGALSTTAEVLSWFTGLRADHHEVEATRVPLRDVPGWHRTDDEIVREDGRHFKVVAVSVRAGSREVGGWTQPLLEPVGRGVAAFLVREFGGVLHALAHVKVEGGFVNAVELGPTVQCRPGNYDPADRPHFFDHVVNAGPERIRFDAVHSEEGGRFRNAESRYMVVEADDSLPGRLPPEYAWVTVGQLAGLLRHGQYVNMHARTLLACLSALR